MVSMGSGNWYRSNAKPTVEESLVVAIGSLRRWIVRDASGTLTWASARRSRSSVGWFVTCGPEPTITFQYRWNDREDVTIPVRLQTTPTQFGGQRRWFTCPLRVDGIPCARRVGNLYLPPGAKYFGCRTCHGLTYRSCQTAHQTERLTAQIERLERRYAAMIGRGR